MNENANFKLETLTKGRHLCKVAALVLQISYIVLVFLKKSDNSNVLAFYQELVPINGFPLAK